MSNDNAYMADYMLKRYYRRREKAIADKGGRCKECGADSGLNFHHVDPSAKEFDIGKAFSGWSESRVQEELKKCVLLCGPCHKKRHAVEHEHGTAHRYWQGCRCVACRRAGCEYHNNYRYKTGRRTRRETPISPPYP